MSLKIRPGLKLVQTLSKLTSKLVALLNQKDSILSSAAETYSLNAALSNSEIQALLETLYPGHFVDLVECILNCSSTTGVAGILKSIGSRFLSVFHSVLGVIPATFHSIF